jgi:hypothetical protein
VLSRGASSGSISVTRSGLQTPDVFSGRPDACDLITGVYVSLNHSVTLIQYFKCGIANPLMSTLAATRRLVPLTMAEEVQPYPRDQLS